MGKGPVWLITLFMQVIEILVHFKVSEMESNIYESNIEVKFDKVWSLR